MRTPWLGLFLFLSLVATTSQAADRAEVVVRPEAAPGPLDNPLKGWCPYPTSGRIQQPYSMVFSYVAWNELEPAEGVYRFEEWENRKWNVPSARGKHMVIRPMVDYPSHKSGLPGWLKGQVKETRYEDHGGGLAPDYNDPKMLAGMERLIEAMGKRYDTNPRVAFIELGLLGFWGEWHTYPRKNLYASPETEQRIIEAYRKAFPNKMLMARTANAYAGTQPWLGFHDDMFPDDTDNGEDWSFLAGIRKAGREANWEHAAVGGEMVPFHAIDWLGKGSDQTMAMLEKGHFTWVGPYCPALEKTQTAEFVAMSEKVVRRLGYQFRLTEIRHPAEVAQGGELKLAIQGENEGVAPFYYRWPVEVALLDDQGKVAAHVPFDCDLRTWLPGAFKAEGEVELKAGPGRYKLAIGCLDPWTNRPAIQFANKLAVVEGWTVLSEVVVGEGGR